MINLRFLEYLFDKINIGIIFWLWFCIDLKFIILELLAIWECNDTIE